MHVPVIALTRSRVQAHRDAQAERLEASLRGLTLWLTTEAAEQPLHDVARSLAERLRALALVCLSLWSALRLDDEEVPGALVHGQASYSFQGWRWEPVRTRFGVFDSLEPCYVRVAGKGPKRLHPHGRRMGLAAGRMSLDVHLLVADLAARMPFAAVAQVAETVGLWVPGPRAMLGIIDQLGPMAMETMRRPAVPHEVSELPEGTHVVIEQDDGGIPHVHPSELSKRRQANVSATRRRGHTRLDARRRRRGRRVDRRRRRKGDKSKNCKMATVYVVYTLEVHEDGTVEGPLHRQVFASTGDKARLRRDVLRAAKARGWGTKPSIYLADGAATHWKGWRTTFQAGTPCVDWYHVAEYLWAAADAVFRFPGATPKGKRAKKAHKKRLAKMSDDKSKWVRALQDELLAGDVDAVLDAIQHLTRRIGTSGPGTRARRRAVADAITYIQNHRAYLNYNTIGHIVMGTGVVEGTIKQLGARLKGPGMRWTVERAQRVLALRALQLSWGGTWTRFERQVEAAHEAITSLAIAPISPSETLTAHKAARKAA